MVKIHIVKCFCGNNHLLAATLWQEPNSTPDAAKRHMKFVMDQTVAMGVVQPGCKLCGNVDFHYEDEATNFFSFREADAEIHKMVRQSAIEQQLVNRN